MAKKKVKAASGSQETMGWEDTIPEELEEPADAYDKAHKAHSKSKGNLNTARDNLIEAMKDSQVERIPIQNGEKYLVLSATDQIRYEKPRDQNGDE